MNGFVLSGFRFIINLVFPLGFGLPKIDERNFISFYLFICLCCVLAGILDISMNNTSVCAMYLFYIYTYMLLG